MNKDVVGALLTINTNVAIGYTQTLSGGDINHKLIYNIMILQHT